MVYNELIDGFNYYSSYLLNYVLHSHNQNFGTNVFA